MHNLLIILPPKLHNSITNQTQKESEKIYQRPRPAIYKSQHRSSRRGVHKGKAKPECPPANMTTCRLRLLPSGAGTLHRYRYKSHQFKKKIKESGLLPTTSPGLSDQPISSRHMSVDVEVKTPNRLQSIISLGYLNLQPSQFWQGPSSFTFTIVAMHAARSRPLRR